MKEMEMTAIKKKGNIRNTNKIQGDIWKRALTENSAKEKQEL